MAQQVRIAGATYEDVPSISVPDANNTFHSFVDTSDANATADKIVNGYSGYVNGVKVVGTRSGGGGGSYILTYDDTSSVGLAEVGDAVTGEPNYIPSGDIHQTIEELELMTGGTAELTASFAGGTLTLGVSLTPTTATKNVATSAPVFVGNGVHFVIEEDNP